MWRPTGGRARWKERPQVGGSGAGAAGVGQDAGEPAALRQVERIWTNIGLVDLLSQFSARAYWT